MAQLSLRRFFLMAVSGMVFAGFAAAQTNVAVINMQVAVLDTEEIRKASTELEARYKPRQAELEKLRRDLEEIQQKLQAGQGKLAPQAEVDLTSEFQRKQRDFQRMTQDLQEDVEFERNEILTRSSRRMQEVVQKLAQAKNLDVVVDVTSTLYVKPALDITQEAIAEYNKAHPVAAAAAPPKPAPPK